MLSDEEEKAIEFIKSELQDEKKVRNDYKNLTGLYGNLEIEIILNLIEKQSKEIEELKENKYGLEEEVQIQAKNIMLCEEALREMQDKIKAKIEECETEKNSANRIHYNYWNRFQAILQSLLEKE